MGQLQASRRRAGLVHGPWCLWHQTLGRPPSRRSALQDLRPSDVVAVSKLDRLSRNVRDLLDVVEVIKETGATLVATEQDLDTSGAMGNFMITLLGAVAQLEAETVSERMRAARAEFVRQGRHGIGRVPFGLRVIQHPEREQRFLVVRPDPINGPRLVEAIDRLLAGEASQAMLAESLGMGAANFSTLLRNPRLVGRTPGSDRPDPDAALIPMTTWRALQDLLDGNGASHEWSRAGGLAGAFICYQCRERLFHDRADHGDGGYRCEQRHPGRPSISRRRADKFATELYLERHGANPEIVVQQDDDSADRAERLAVVDEGIDEVLTQLRRTRGDEGLVSLTATLSQLQADRDAIEQEPSVR